MFIEIMGYVYCHFFSLSEQLIINGYKKKRSNFYVFEKPTKEELIEKNEEDREDIERELEDQLHSLESLSKQLEDIEKTLIEEKTLDWKGKKKVEI